MRRCIPGLLILMGGVAPAGAAPLVFSATGCGPYNLEEERLLERHVAMVSSDRASEFLVHLGDVVPGSKKAWPESQYAKVAAILKTSRIPVLVVPGDNEWNDLSQPDIGWKHWSKHFLNFERHFSRAPKLAKQPGRPENFAWTSKGVLLVGLNLVGGRVHDQEEWETRMRHDADWVQQQLAVHGAKVRALVVFAQAMPSPDHEPFFRAFVAACKEFKKPVLYLHADGHIWQLEKGWRAPNLWRVQTDQLGRNPPVQVTVTDDPDEPFEFERRPRRKKSDD
ncbi:MAG: hypothetical protein L0Y71_21480 [Gemmataceae bacterium]|nr:hypothetical protein [Gemmataceae bacterium]